MTSEEEVVVVRDSPLLFSQLQVDDGEYFNTLPENSVFLFLRSGEVWHPAGTDAVRAGEIWRG